MAAFDSTQIARLATGLYAVQIGNTTMQWALDSVNGNAYGSVAALANALYTRDFGGMTNAAVASLVVANVGITTAAQVAEATTIVTNALNAAAAGKKGETILGILNGFATLTTPAYADAVAAFNAQIAIAEDYAKTANTKDVSLASLTPVFNLDNSSLIAGLQSMHLTGNQDVRINFSNTANQITGLDLNGNGTIEADGRENKVTGVASGFEAVDAYPRNPWNHKDTANNFLGDIDFDGRSYQGDGVKTNGNIVLGGLGGDTIYGGVGNDFLAGGGVAQGSSKQDYLSGGRNADFFFAEFSAIGAPSASLEIDGGNTADDVSAGNEQSPQDADWLLLEANDDDEPVQIWLNDDNLADQRDGADGLVDSKGRVLSRAGDSMVIDDIENIDASGNLYGFLNNIDVLVGKRATDDRDSGATAANVGYGSAAQLWISGSNAANIIIGGYDNDYIEGRGGNDLLMGGNLNFKNDPNLSAIINNGRDELVGGAGSDNLVFETDGGIYEGGDTYDVDDGEPDTLWLTRETFGTQDAATVTADGFVRLDLGVGKVGGLANYAGYGGADKNAATTRYTSDQTNYKAGYARTQVQDMESVIATGLGAIDYKAAGANSPNNASAFDNQQNHRGYDGNLDLRGTTGANTLYSAAGTDVIEGREGNDNLSGGDGNDDFYFSTLNAGSNGADGVDVIHRQSDTNGDNLWDTDAAGAGLFERDFNIGGTSTKGASSLTVDLGTTNLASADVALTSFSIKIGGVTFAVADSSALMAANSAAEVAALVNTAYKAQDAKVTAVAVGNTIVVTDADGRDISDTVAEGYAVGGVVSNGAFSAQATFNPAGTTTTKDRLIYKSYEDRADNEGTDDDSVLGSHISLGTDAYAEDLVIWFGDEDSDGLATTRIAEDQAYTIRFTNLTTQDRVTVTVNGVNYSLQVGVDLDGNVIAAEDGVGDTQAGIQTAFLTRLNDFINTFMDDDTTAGAVDSAFNGVDTLTITQRDYNGEETVFMNKPTVALQNLSGGEPATVVVTNVSQHEVELLDFDGRNAELNETNVLFVGQEFVSRAELSTALNAGGTQTGTEAIVVDVGPNNLQDVVFGTTTAIPNNTATNSPLSTVPNGVAVHGDDFLLGGNGLDTINGGTGDDRVEGSIGGNGTTTWDTLDGGKNFYAVQVLGEPQARVYILNKWEAANPTKVTALSGLTISSITLINQSESGTGTISGVFDDTLQFTQRNFTAGTTRFTVALNDFVVTGGVVELRNDGAGTVGVDVDGNGTIDNWTKFTNFENIRTVSGTSNAVAGDGQGNDTLDVTLLSSTTTGAGGIYYNLTNDGAAGEVRYSKDAFVTGTGLGTATGDRPAAADYEELVLKVDGVESVRASTGNDLVRIDETEAAKNNTFEAGLGTDKIVYEDDYDAGSTGVGQPTVTVKVNTNTDTDTVTMKGGRVGTLTTSSGGAVDTLVGVEYIQLAGETAQSAREDDLLDVTAMVSGAVVDYTNGEIRTSATAGTGVQLVIENIVQLERVNADGNDLVIVADADVMNNNNRSDELDATAAKNILFMTYLDYDDLNTNATTRKSFAAQVLDSTIRQVINQGQFTFSMSEVGTEADVDRVDYSNELGRIIVPVGQGQWTAPGAATNRPQYVVVDGDSDSTLTDGESRVDALYSTEEIVAAKGQSVMDFTDVGQNRQITFTYVAPSGNPAENQVVEQAVRIADGNGNTISGLNAFIERYTYNKTTTPVADATWNRIEGSDAGETVIYQGSEDLVNQAGLDHRYTNDVLTLRGGTNEVRYSPLETSITAAITVVEENTATTNVAEGLITATITFQDGLGAALTGGGTHTITSHTSDNSTSAGSLKIEGSQDAEDSVSFTATSPKTFILGTSPGVINVQIGSATTIVLTGFERITDSSTDDVYDIRAITSLAGLSIVDDGTDHDAIRVANDSVNYNGSGVNTIDLDNISATAGGLNFEFDVLDLTNLTSAVSALTINGGTDAAPVTVDPSEAADNTDEVVLGALARVATINDFESMVLTEATVANGTSFTFNPGSNTFTQGSTTITTSANEISFSGLVLERATLPGGATQYGTSYVPAATTGVTVTIAGTAGGTVHGGAGADTINGGGLADVIRGGAGNDTVSGGVGTETRTVQLDLSMDGAAGGSVVATFDGFSGAITTVTEGAEIAVGAGSNAVAAALATKLMANLAAINAGATWSNGAQLVSITANANVLTFTFNAGADVLNAEAITVAAAGDAGIVISGTTVATEGSNGGADTFLFEATAAANGADTINDFNGTGTATTDRIDVRAFLGAATTFGAAADFVATGLNLTAGANVGVVFNKTGGTLAAADVAVAAAAGKIAVPDDGKRVVLVTEDANGVSDATINAYRIYYIEDTQTATPGQTYTVTLVGTINATTELNAADLVGANDIFV